MLRRAVEKKRQWASWPGTARTIPTCQMALRWSMASSFIRVLHLPPREQAYLQLPMPACLAPSTAAAVQPIALPKIRAVSKFFQFLARPATVAGLSRIVSNRASIVSFHRPHIGERRPLHALVLFNQGPQIRCELLHLIDSQSLLHCFLKGRHKGIGGCFKETFPAPLLIYTVLFTRAWNDLVL